MKTSSYYENDNYKSLINAKTNTVVILSTNIQYVNAKLNELNGYLIMFSVLQVFRKLAN